MRASRLFARLSLALAFPSGAAGACWAPTTRGRELPTPAAIPVRGRHRQAQSLADAPWFQVFDDPALQALIREAIANNLDLQIAVARVEEARARAGIAKSFLYPQVDGVAQLRRAAGVERPAGGRWTTRKTRRTRAACTAFSCRGKSICSAGSGGSMRPPWRWSSPPNRAAAASWSRWSATSRRITSCCASSICSSPSRGRRSPQRRDRHLLPEPPGRRRLEPARARSHRGQPGADGGRDSADSSSRSRSSRTRSRCSCGRSARPRSAREHSRPARPLPPPIPPGLPASLLERRPDVVQAEQLLVAANADIGAAKALFFPTISLTGFLGGVSGDLTTFLGGDGGGLVVRGRPAAAGVSSGAAFARNLRSGAGAIRRRAGRLSEGGAQRLSRGRQLRWSPFRSSARVRIQQEIGVTALQDASDLARARYDSGLASYLEILTADQELFKQQLLLAQTRGAELGRAPSSTARSAAAGSRTGRRHDGEGQTQDRRKSKNSRQGLSRKSSSAAGASSAPCRSG